MFSYISGAHIFPYSVHIRENAGQTMFDICEYNLQCLSRGMIHSRGLSQKSRSPLMEVSFCRRNPTFSIKSMQTNNTIILLKKLKRKRHIIRKKGTKHNFVLKRCFLPFTSKSRKNFMLVLNMYAFL